MTTQARDGGATSEPPLLACEGMGEWVCSKRQMNRSTNDASTRSSISIEGPLFNQDGTEFFYVNKVGEMGADLINRYIDQLAEAGIGTFVSCGNGQRTNYPSKVWQTEWDGYIPGGPDDQPMLGSSSDLSRDLDRQRMENLFKLGQSEEDFHHLAAKRCRHHKIGFWMSIRMNDVHACTNDQSPLLSRFFLEQKHNGQLRAPHRLHEGWWNWHALDWERADVQEHFWKLVCEQLERYDLDGLELDWMRIAYHFRPGRELAGGKALTIWLRRVRNACDQAAERLGHPVALGVRVPACPQTARRCGLDAVEWARQGLIDLLVPTPTWATADFDMPMELWSRLVEGTGVTLAGGLEVRYQSVPNGSFRKMNPALTLGAAAGIFHGGADCIYLFNYFPTSISLMEEWDMNDFHRAVSVLKDEKLLHAHPRTYAVTFADTRASGEPASNILPMENHNEEFPWPPGCTLRIRTGPLPQRNCAGQLRVEFSGALPEGLQVYMNSHRLDSKDSSEENVFLYEVPIAFWEEEVQIVELVGDAVFCVIRMELDVIPELAKQA